MSKFISNAFVPVLTTTFVMAKMFGKINWPWWAVFLPLEILASVIIISLAILGLVICIKERK